MFYDSFHVELLPPAAQDLVRATCRPRQQVVLGYWRQLLEQPIAQITAMVEQTTDTLRASGVPYPPRLPVTTSSPATGSGSACACPRQPWKSGPGPVTSRTLADPQRFARGSRGHRTVWWPSERPCPPLGASSPAAAPACSVTFNLEPEAPWDRQANGSRGGLETAAELDGLRVG